MTSNPTIFMQAIEDSNAYDRDLADLARRQVSRDEAARALTAADIRSGCDAFSTVFGPQPGVTVESRSRLTQGVVDAYLAGLEQAHQGVWTLGKSGRWGPSSSPGSIQGPTDAWK